MDMQQSPFAFTVIMPVYKVLPYIREAIDSLIGQDFGFARVQLILVDDGSPDGCGAVCDEYAARFPENVTVVHKENGGVSSARNAGLPLARGKYVNFMDPDDLLTPNALSLVYSFLEAHPEADLASIPVHFFEGREGEHVLNYKFKDGTRVIDLREEWTAAQLQVASAFIRREALSELCFDTRLTTAEDAKFMLQLLLNKPLLGVVDGCSYRYRRRGDTGEPSLVQGQTSTPDWYLPCLRHFHEELIHRSLDRFECVPRYIQYALVYEMQWRIRKACIPPGVLTAEEEQSYLDKLRELLQYIDDGVILALKTCFIEHKLRILRLKYGRLPELVFRSGNVDLYYGERRVTFLTIRPCHFQQIRLRPYSCEVEGFFTLFPLGDLQPQFLARFDGQILPCESRFVREPSIALGETLLDYPGFRLRLPLDRTRGRHRLQIGMRLGSSVLWARYAVFEPDFPLSDEEGASFASRGWTLRWQQPLLCFETYSRKAALRKELRRLLSGGKSAPEA